MTRYKLLLMLAVLPMISACGTLTASDSPTGSVATSAPPANTACVAFSPIIYSRLKDTAATIAAVKSHNAAWVALCEPDGAERAK